MKQAAMTDLEFLREYAKCGIYHNYGQHPQDLRYKLEVMESAIAALDSLYDRLEAQREAHDHLAEIHNRYKSLMTAKINEKTEAILIKLK